MKNVTGVPDTGDDDLVSIAEYASASRDVNSSSLPRCSPYANLPPACSPSPAFGSGASPIPYEIPDPALDRSFEEEWHHFQQLSELLEVVGTTPSARKVIESPLRKAPSKLPAGVHLDLLQSQSIWDCIQRQCKKRCFEGHDECILATGIKDLRTRVLNSKHKAQFMLAYMVENEIKSNDGSFKKRKVDYRAPGTGNSICLNCFAHAAGFAQVNGQPSITFKRTLAAFNKGDQTVDFRDGRLGIRKKVFSMEARIAAWIEGWLPANHETSPMNPDELHLNAKSKTAVWVLCCDDFVRQAGLEDASEAEKNCCRPSKAYFLQVLRNKFKTVIHKHKKFAQCSLCSLFKALSRKCKVMIEIVVMVLTSFTDRSGEKANR